MSEDKFRPGVFRKCVERLEEVIVNPDIPFESLIGQLRSKKDPWWKEYSTQYPTQKEAITAANVYKRMRRGGPSSESDDKVNREEKGKVKDDATSKNPSMTRDTSSGDNLRSESVEKEIQEQ